MGRPNGHVLRNALLALLQQPEATLGAALSARLDPEDLREVIAAYRRAGNTLVQ